MSKYIYRMVNPRNDKDMIQYIGLEKMLSDFCNDVSTFDAERIKYQSILYIGVMVTEDGTPYVLEYNTRSGNPEWLAILGLLNGKLYDVYNNFFNNEIEKISQYWDQDKISVALYGLSAGYPETIRSNFSEEILGLDDVKADVDIFAESLTKKNDKYFPNGGRVLALRKVGNDFDNIMQDLVEGYNSIKMNGLFFRNDVQLFKDI